MATKLQNAPWKWKTATEETIGSYVGVKDELVIVYGEGTPYLKVMDGETPGGIYYFPEQITYPMISLTYPTVGLTDTGVSPHLTCAIGPFSSLDTTDIQTFLLSDTTGLHLIEVDLAKHRDRAAKLQWVIQTTQGAVVWDSGQIDPGNYDVSTADHGVVLTPGSSYTVKVRYFTKTGVTSAYTTPTPFTVAGATVPANTQTVFSSESLSYDNLGSSVALSEDRQWLFTGATGDDDLANNSGMCYAFKKQNGVYQFAVKLAPTGLGASTSYGQAIAVNGAGDRVAIGAPGHSSYSGMVVIYQNINNAWVLQQQFTTSDIASGDYVGASLSMSRDGTWLAVSSARDDEGGYNTGSVYLYQWNGSAYTQYAKLTAPDYEANDGFGQCVSLSADGTCLAVSTTRKGVSGNYIGAVYVYTAVSGSWGYTTKLTANDGISADYFGTSVSLNANGTILAIGATGCDDKGSNSGAVYVYEKVGGVWVHVKKIVPTDSVTSEQLGRIVALSDDGNTLLATAPYANRNGVTKAGVGYLYKRSLGWDCVSVLDAPDAHNTLMMGELAAAISSTGQQAYIASYRRLLQTGAIYVYE